MQNTRRTLYLLTPSMFAAMNLLFLLLNLEPVLGWPVLISSQRHRHYWWFAITAVATLTRQITTGKRSMTFSIENLRPWADACGGGFLTNFVGKTLWTRCHPIMIVWDGDRSNFGNHCKTPIRFIRATLLGMLHVCRYFVWRKTNRQNLFLQI